jgi:hypothetical protein
MKIVLISAAFASFIFGAAFAREIILTPGAPYDGASVSVEHRTVRLASPAREGGAFCSTAYVTTTRADGSSATRKSVNCDE